MAKVTVWEAANSACSSSPAPTFCATRMLPAIEMPSPREMRKKTSGNAIPIDASASSLYWPSQMVSTRL
jgi:hypothetical protein